MTLKTLRNFFVILALAVLSFGIGYRFGLSDKNSSSAILPRQIYGKTSIKDPNLDFSLFWDVWERLNRYYIDKKALDFQKMFYGAISGMVSALDDPYTVFLPPKQNKEVKDDLSGKFEGIGAQLGIKDKKIVVVAPLKDTPADKAGLKPEDWIIKVDSKETSNWTLPETISKIRGPKGTKVILTIMHRDATKSADISVTRDTIKVASVEWEILKLKISRLTGTASGQSAKLKVTQEDCDDCEKVVYLKLGRFGDDTNDEWNKAVEEINSKLKTQNSKLMGLIFDLRNNPGGYLSGSVFIASEFLKDGTVVIQESAGNNKQVYSVNRKGRLTDIPMVVLVNKGSASASEIVAGALKDRERAKLVGETTFGKGSIQEAQELAQGAGIHITTAKWLLPSGKWINGTGVEPNVKIELDPSQPAEDLQLTKALELLIK